MFENSQYPIKSSLQTKLVQNGITLIHLAFVRMAFTADLLSMKSRIALNLKSVTSNRSFSPNLIPKTFITLDLSDLFFQTLRIMGPEKTWKIGMIDLQILMGHILRHILISQHLLMAEQILFLIFHWMLYTVMIMSIFPSFQVRVFANDFNSILRFCLI